MNKRQAVSLTRKERRTTRFLWYNRVTQITTKPPTLREGDVSSERTDQTVDVTTKYATTVPDMSAAWAFIMDRLDQVGPDPTVVITPVWSRSADNPVGRDHSHDPVEDWDRHFEVVVEGMVEEGRA